MSRYYFCSRCGSKVEYTKKCSCLKNKKSERNKKYIDNDKFYRTRKWRALRLRVLKRDNFLCQRCLNKYGILNSDNLEAHHIKSRVNYPELELEENNIVCVCKTCNLQLGTSDKLDFKYEIRNTEHDDFNLFNLY